MVLYGVSRPEENELFGQCSVAGFIMQRGTGRGAKSPP